MGRKIETVEGKLVNFGFVDKGDLHLTLQRDDGINLTLRGDMENELVSFPGNLEDNTRLRVKYYDSGRNVDSPKYKFVYFGVV